MIVSIEDSGIRIDGRLLSRVGPNDIPIGVSNVDMVFINSGAANGYQNGLMLDTWWNRLKDGGLMVFPSSIKNTERAIKAVNYLASRNGIIPTHDGSCIAIQKQFRKLIEGSCVLVGNGPSLDGCGKGAAIDQFDNVIRFNNYITNGFECDVGSKADIWCCYGKNASTPRANPPKKIINMHGAVNDPSWFEPREIWRVPVSFYHRIRDEIRPASNLPDERRRGLIPSSGITLMLWLLEHHLVPVVYYCGFDHFDRQSTAGRHHYWMKSTHSDSLEHDGEAERLLVEKEGARCVRI